LEATEQALIDYKVKLHDDHSEQQGGEPIQQADDMHEANLHATIGALRMNHPSELHLVVDHLTSSIELYARDPVKAGRALADARLNLAKARFKQGEYDLSGKVYTDALDVYQQAEGEIKKKPPKGGLEQEQTEPVVDPAPSDELLPAQKGDDAEAPAEANTGKGGDDDPTIDLTAYKASIQNDTAAQEDEL
jgi:hypothetical protein